jgi:Asp-tRNA(Asn)/Glu-tRNA(Gln) amidotransferase A subunit family amidase
MTQQSLHYKTLSEVAARIAEGNLDSAGVTEALLERIEALEPKLHSYITVLGEQALARAQGRGAFKQAAPSSAYRRFRPGKFPPGSRHAPETQRAKSFSRPCKSQCWF